MLCVCPLDRVQSCSESPRPCAGGDGQEQEELCGGDQHLPGREEDGRGGVVPAGKLPCLMLAHVCCSHAATRWQSTLAVKGAPENACTLPLMSG